MKIKLKEEKETILAKRKSKLKLYLLIFLLNKKYTGRVFI